MLFVASVNLLEIQHWWRVGFKVARLNPWNAWFLNLFLLFVHIPVLNLIELIIFNVPGGQRIGHDHFKLWVLLEHDVRLRPTSLKCLLHLHQFISLMLVFRPHLQYLLLIDPILLPYLDIIYTFLVLQSLQQSFIFFGHFKMFAFVLIEWLHCGAVMQLICTLRPMHPWIGAAHDFGHSLQQPLVLSVNLHIACMVPNFSSLGQVDGSGCTLGNVGF